jgi:hypothetical protein
MEMAGMQQEQQPVHDRSEYPVDHIHRPNTAGQNDPSAGSSGVFATLEGLLMEYLRKHFPKENLPRPQK